MQVVEFVNYLSRPYLTSEILSRNAINQMCGLQPFRFKATLAKSRTELNSKRKHEAFFYELCMKKQKV